MASSEEEICAALTRMALAGDGVVVGVGMAVLAIRTWLRFYFHSRALHQLNQTPISRIADLRDLISEDISRKPVVIARGKVDTIPASRFTKDGDVLIAHNAAEKAVIVQRTQTCLYNEWRGLFGWSSDLRGLLGWATLKEQVTVSIRKVPFVLVEEAQGFYNGATVHINLDESKHALPLETVYHQLHPVQASPYTFLQAIFGRGYPVGILDEEKILPPGREITAVGILDRAINGQLIIKSSKQLPLFLTELTKDQLMIELASHTKVLLWSGVLFSTCAMGVLGYAVFRNWRKYKQWKLDRERRREQDRLSVERIDEESGHRTQEVGPNILVTQLGDQDSHNALFEEEELDLKGWLYFMQQEMEDLQRCMRLLQGARSKDDPGTEGSTKDYWEKSCEYVFLLIIYLIRKERPDHSKPSWANGISPPMSV